MKSCGLNLILLNMAEKKTTKAAAVKAAPKAKRTSAKKVVATVALNAENVGFKAGDVYQALATAGKALSAEEISKLAKISLEEAYLGMGWLFKEGKIKDESNKVTLA